MSFKVGDRVKRKESMWKGIEAYTLQPYEEFEVTAYFNDCKFPLVCFEETGDYQWDAAYFELVEDKQKIKPETWAEAHQRVFSELIQEEKEELKVPKFCIGDRVISVKNTPSVPEGFIGKVVEIGDGSFPVSVTADDGHYTVFEEDELELLSVAKDPDWRNRDDITPQDIQGIARPILQERKIGKVKMELFDEGFPNAIMEIARVMTWAAEHKGYKPHDWKNLPNADTEFSAAASRHKVKSFIQKVEGVEPLQRTDEESKISHLAHQAFNVLAELELVLTGVIK